MMALASDKTCKNNGSSLSKAWKWSGTHERTFSPQLHQMPGHAIDTHLRPRTIKYVLVHMALMVGGGGRKEAIPRGRGAK